MTVLVIEITFVFVILSNAEKEAETIERKSICCHPIFSIDFSKTILLIVLYTFEARRRITPTSDFFWDL